MHFACRVENRTQNSPDWRRHSSCVVRRRSNIGAGAITCNYDGFRKNKTIIGKNCFIGSNTSLVAPLNIKKGSLVGAGTVVNKDVPIETVVYRKSELIKKNKKK